ncbi:MAG: hypothetical protein ISR51_07805 [Rhodospirillales bacterium]|nr:hypothetical protein [Alphaproteobacteria bacterium]MBL6948566.1 hypothetical protein [Rhodospirillales bacterium]
MRSCDDCPSAKSCAGNNLHPVLKQVYDLYAQGLTNKFEILDALDDGSEELLERFNDRLSPDCWSKAALLAIAEVIEDMAADSAGDGALEEDVRAAVGRAKEAFERFPWQLSELVEQAPDLYQAVLEASPDTGFAERVSKRQMVKICKDVVYG